MKTAIYLESDVLQIVLTPETEAEKAVLSVLSGELDGKAYRGSFYSCRGGWVRQKDFPAQSCWPGTSLVDEARLLDESLVVVVSSLKIHEAQAIVAARTEEPGA